ncbi:carbohydrate kinase family protein [Pseudonocardia spinosispora]|uniref:carbohydrate kinase family protein n=1 Tax=Pseudonocardia spinosispora TaxID=103441 RepID=UPI000409266A|nr:carbohydrate kinase family protein [Pseudonocardia spinosispora]
MIVFCGYANRDQTVSVPALPGEGARVQATSIHEQDGGMAANAAVAAARVGADVRFAGVLGPDPRSTRFLDALTRDGIDVRWTPRTGTLTTAIVLLTPDGERVVISQDDDLDTERVAAVFDLAAAEGAGWLYLDGYRFPSAEAVLHGRPGPTVVVDLDGCEGVPAVEAALSLAGHAVIGRSLALDIVGGDEALAGLARAHQVQLIVTDGPKGWTLFGPDGGRHSGAALAVSAVDSTGAGDCFVGVYCAELDRGADPVSAAAFASVAAGLSCTRYGARDGLPDRQAVLAELDPPRYR